LRYNFSFVLQSGESMALSLRLPVALESEIVAHSVRTGSSKSAVILRSIEAYLRSNAQPSAFALYEAEMQSVSEVEAAAATPDPRAHKQAIVSAVRQKHAQRSARARQAAVAPSPSRKKAT
jgi:hypothetical protein